MPPGNPFGFRRPYVTHNYGCICLGCMHDRKEEEINIVKEQAGLDNHNTNCGCAACVAKITMATDGSPIEYAPKEMLPALPPPAKETVSAFVSDVMSPTQKLWVYGTLKKHYHNHDRYLGRAKLIEANVWLADFAMMHCGGYPAVYSSWKERVRGDIYEVTTEEMKRIDQLEGVSAGLYRRERREFSLANGVWLWAWFYVQDWPGTENKIWRKVASGIWDGENSATVSLTSVLPPLARRSEFSGYPITSYTPPPVGREAGPVVFGGRPSMDDGT